MGITRDELYAQAARRLRAEFANLRCIDHRTTKGAAAETLVRDFLDNHLPRRYATGSGFIVDFNDRVSRQTDVIVYDALNCPIYRSSEQASIFPNDNVAAVIEVKSRLDKEKLAQAAENIAAAKRLQKSESPLDEDTLVPTLGCVFAFGSTLSPRKLCEHYIETIENHGIGDRIDVILVLDKYVATLVAKLPRGEWTPTILRPPNREGTHLGTGTLACGEEALDVFFRLLLVHLAMFRQMVPHPGFRFRHTSWRISYFDSVTHESDPERRAAKLLSYRKSVVRQFRRLSRSG